MRYLVTGGAGFIGSNTVDELVRRGHGVVVLDDLSGGKEENLADVRNKITFMKGSITELETVQKAMQQADYVIHLAARTSVPRSVKDPLETNRINVEGTLNVLVAARDNKVRRVVFAASSSAYGETPTLPKTESMQPVPISPYGVSKYVGELYAQAFGKCYGMENVSLRYFNIFGPRQNPFSAYGAAIPKFVSAILRGESPVVFGDGRQSRDFTYVDNAVAANLLAASAPAKRVSGQVFNVACGRNATLLDVIGEVNRLLGTRIRPKFAPPRAGDVRHSKADISKAKRLLGYRASVSLREGLERTIAWLRDRV